MDANPVEYWNFQAKSYDEKIFSSIDEDSTGIILRTLDTFAETQDDGPFGRCVDFGCGAGKYLPALAARFKSVVAYDLSPKLADVARKEAVKKALHHVEVRVRDLSSSWLRDGISVTCDVNGQKVEDDECERYGFAVMANVMIAPDSDCVRAIMLRNAFRALCPGGRMLVIVPSLESALYVGMRCSDVNFDGPYMGKAVASDLLRGVVKRYGVRTKHFLEPEFCLAAAQAGFMVESCEKVSYPWRAELSLDTEAELPTALRKPSPLPWDWLFVLKKPGPGSEPPLEPPPSRPRPLSAFLGPLPGIPAAPSGLTLPVLQSHSPVPEVSDED